MNELINVSYDNADRPTVSGRELHEALGVKSKYADWFKNMCSYGFTENVDFVAFSKNLETPNSDKIVHVHKLTNTPYQTK